MDANLNLEFRLIKSKADLNSYKAAILELFKVSFGTHLDELTWEWAYIDNPNGEPIVALCFDNNKLIGHYAIIPFHLRRINVVVKCLLSMTTMVHIDYRRYGLFVKLADLAYAEALKQNYQIVFGFPNQNSAPGFSKKLGWTLSEKSYVAKVSNSDLMQLNKSYAESNIYFDIRNTSLLEWRLKKPSTQYQNLNETLIVKAFESNIDILYHEFDFSGLDPSSECFVMITNDNSFIDKKAFDYVFGYKVLGKEVVTENDFIPSLIMSDVF